MKGKSVQVKAKQPPKGVQKQNNAKVQKKPAAEPIVKAVKAAAAPKKGQKPAKKTPPTPPPPKKVEIEEEEEEDESEDEEIDSGADVKEEQASDDGAEVDEDDEDDENEEDDDDEEEDEDDEEEADADADAAEAADEDGEAPSEAPIEKKPVKGGIPKINTGSVPKTFPANQIVIVRNLPRSVKQIDMVEVFAKCGDIHTIHTEHSDLSSSAVVAFHTPEAATAALAAHEVAVIKGKTIKVFAKRVKPTKAEAQSKFEESTDRTMFVGNLKMKTTEAQVREHFAHCGKIEDVMVKTRGTFTFAFVVFEDVAAIEEAKKLHLSVLNDATITANPKGDDKKNDVKKDPTRTVIVKNTSGCESFPGDKLKAIFNKCGEIIDVSILCKKHVLAFVTFAEEAAAEKALKMSGTTVDDLKLEIDQFQTVDRHHYCVFVTSVPYGTTEEDFQDFFVDCGEIERINMYKGKASIKFKTADGFCKAFLKNECKLNSKHIFIEPYSERKRLVTKNSFMGEKRKHFAGPGKPKFVKKFKHA